MDLAEVEGSDMIRHTACESPWRLRQRPGEQLLAASRLLDPRGI